MTPGYEAIVYFTQASGDDYECISQLGLGAPERVAGPVRVSMWHDLSSEGTREYVVRGADVALEQRAARRTVVDPVEALRVRFPQVEQVRNVYAGRTP